MIYCLEMVSKRSTLLTKEANDQLGYVTGADDGFGLHVLRPAS